MTMVVAGIDVSKQHLDVHVDGVDRRFENTASNWRGLHGFLRTHSVTRVVTEAATGRYHRSVHQSLHERGYEALVVNPRNTRHFALAFGELAKTDRIDACMRAPRVKRRWRRDLQHVQVSSGGAVRHLVMPGRNALAPVAP